MQGAAAVNGDFIANSVSVVTCYTVTTVAAYRASDFSRVLRLSAEQVACKMIDSRIHLVGVVAAGNRADFEQNATASPPEKQDEDDLMQCLIGIPCQGHAWGGGGGEMQQTVINEFL